MFMLILWIIMGSIDLGCELHSKSENINKIKITVEDKERKRNKI